MFWVKKILGFGVKFMGFGSSGEQFWVLGWGKFLALELEILRIGAGDGSSEFSVLRLERSWHMVYILGARSPEVGEISKRGVQPRENMHQNRVLARFLPEGSKNHDKTGC